MCKEHGLVVFSHQEGRRYRAARIRPTPNTMTKVLRVNFR